MTSGEPRLRRKRFTGVVTAVGNMAETITVAVERFREIPKIRKQVRRTKTFLVHDPSNQAVVGNRVVIEETRPISKRKHFRVIHVESF